jgi:hypothetical protein
MKADKAISLLAAIVDSSEGAIVSKTLEGASPRTVSRVIKTFL